MMKQTTKQMRKTKDMIKQTTKQMRKTKDTMKNISNMVNTMELQLQKTLLILQQKFPMSQMNILIVKKPPPVNINSISPTEPTPSVYTSSKLS